MLPKTSEKSPFLGLPGNANLLAVTRAGGRTVCRVNPMVRTVILVVLCVFAGVGGVFAFQADSKFGWMLLAFEVPSLFLAYWLIGRLGFSKSLEIAKGELAFHTGRAFPERLRKAEIAGFRMETVRYEPDEGSPCDNHLLVVETKGREKIWLVLSPDRALIEGLLKDCS